MWHNYTMDVGNKQLLNINKEPNVKTNFGL
jgi:hypothetical protein